MNSLNEKIIHTAYGDKKIAVHVMNILYLNEDLDIMTVSAFQGSYDPVPRSMIGGLYRGGISVYELSKEPEIDLRKNAHVWLSDEVKDASLPIKRIGCIEMLPLYDTPEDDKVRESQILPSIQAYFHMLEIASLSGIRMEKIGLPVLGAGYQGISTDLILIPVLNECTQFLENNKQVKEIHIITLDQRAAYRFAKALDDSYTVARNTSYEETQSTETNSAYAFISYSSKDKNIADNLCSKLENNGIKVWYAPRDIHTNDYATAIVQAISRCSHFVVILSKNSLQSQHVLNEIDLAFSQLNRSIHFKPLRIDEEELGAAFTYYLSRQHWMDAHIPPLEARLDEFVQKLLVEQ